MVVERDTSRILGPLEADVMDVMWAVDEPLTVRTVLDRLNEGRTSHLAYTTVMTVMARLADKGILSRRRDGRGYSYQAEISDPAAIAVANVVRDFGDAAIAGFVDHARSDPKVLARLQRLLDDA